MVEILCNFLEKITGKETFFKLIYDHHYPDTNIIHWHYKLRKLQANIPLNIDAKNT